MAAGTLHLAGRLRIDQGATWTVTLTWKIAGVAVNLTGYSARMQARSTVDSDEVILSLTSGPGGGITLGGVAGTIVLSMAADETQDLVPGNDYCYDLELVAGDGVTVTRLVEGRLEVKAEVTR